MTPAFSTIKPSPTMADVAKLAGVSAMTVSRALRHDASVARKTRERVLEVIDEIGYVPDQAAGALSSGRSGLIAVVVPTLTDPLYGLIARGLDDTLAAQGLQLFLGFSDFMPANEERLLEMMMRRRPEAIAVAGGAHTEKASRMLANAGVPVVEFMNQPRRPIDHVLTVDPVGGGRATMRHLAGKGRRQIALLAPKPVFGAWEEARIEGLLASAREFGMPAPEVIRHGGPLGPLDQGMRGAADAAGRGVDAVVCMNDYSAVGAIGELRRRGVGVPDDIAVMGFGDCEIARHIDPSITTIGFSATVMGVELGKLLLSALDAGRLGRAQAPYRLTLEVQVVERQSA